METKRCFRAHLSRPLPSSLSLPICLYPDGITFIKRMCVMSLCYGLRFAIKFELLCPIDTYFCIYYYYFFLLLHRNYAVDRHFFRSVHVCTPYEFYERTLYLFGGKNKFAQKIFDARFFTLFSFLWLVHVRFLVGK